MANTPSTTRTEFTNKVVGPKEVQRIDISKHVGKKVKIAEVQENFGQYGPFIRVVTESVEKIKGKEGDIDIRGTKLFSLNVDEDGSIYWAKGGVFDLFMQKMGCKHWKDLVGKTVQLVPVTNKKDGREFLSIS